MHVSGELDKRLAGLNEHIDFQVGGEATGKGVERRCKGCRG